MSTRKRFAWHRGFPLSRSAAEKDEPHCDASTQSGRLIRSMKTHKEKLISVASAFQAGLDEAIASAAQNGKVAIGVDLIKSKVGAAFQEACESEFDENGVPIVISPLEAASIWMAVLKINESAYSQGFFRRHKELSRAGEREKIRGLALELI